MKRFLFVSLTIVLLLQGCTGESTPPKPEHGYLPDSLEGRELVGAGNDTKLHKDTLVIGKEIKAGDPSETFQQKNERLSSSVFGMYSKDQLDPMEAFPNFKTATKSAFLRLRRSQPTAAQAGPKVYPRVLLKSYQFAQWDNLKAEFEAYVNDMEHGKGDFVLGEAMDAVKTPPILCFMTQTWLVMVQWSCQYRNDEWEQVTAAFFEFGRKEGAKNLLAFTCEAGKVKYY